MYTSIRKNYLLLLILFLFPLLLLSQNTVSIEKNYNNWSWDNVYVAKNNYISIAIVPEAGGRMLEFNLGTTPSLWVNPKLFGKSFSPNEELNGTKDWRNFGGYRLVPIPTNNIAASNSSGGKTSRWPPPAMIGDNPYTAKIITDKDNNKVINVLSGIQQLPVPKFISGKYVYPQTIDEELQYERNLHIEEGKSLVFIDHRLHNKGTKTVNRGLKITSQQTSRSSPDLEDGENFLVYIPFDKNNKLSNGDYFDIKTTPQNRWNFINRNRFPISKNNPEHVEKYFNTGTNWTGEVAPGIFELHYDFNLMSGFHINSSKSWICFVDKINMTAFAKIFEPYDTNKNYEYGLNMEIYNSGLETGYLETEVKTPIYTIAPGESFKYKETQAAAKIISLPILEVNNSGVITEKLNFISEKIKGKYGVFIKGTGYVKIKSNSSEEIIELGKVNPLEAFILEKNINITRNSEIEFELYIIDSQNIKHNLDYLKIDATLSNNSYNSIKNHNIYITPNPSKGIITVSNSSEILYYSISDLTGKTLRKNIPLVKEKINLSKYKSGIYFLTFKTKKGILQKKVIIN